MSLSIVQRRYRGADGNGDSELVSEQVALGRQKDFLYRWKPGSDTYTLFLAPFVYCSSTVFTAGYINNYYRRAFRVGGAGRIISYISTLTMPTMLSFLTYHLFTERKVLLGKTTCAMCEGSRLGLRQVVLGAVYPTVVSSFMGIYYAIATSSVPLPQMNFPMYAQDLQEHVVAMAREWGARSRRVAWPLMIIVAAQMLGGAAMIEGQHMELALINRKIQVRLEAAAREEEERGRCDDE